MYRASANRCGRRPQLLNTRSSTPGTKIPIRTFSDCNDVQAGVFETSCAVLPCERGCFVHLG
jgi:hypothetical protein